MRPSLLLLACFGCGPVQLGMEAIVPVVTIDAGAAGPLDAATVPALEASVPEVALTIDWPDPCACAELTVEGRGGRPPYTFEWSDGLTAQQRTVCPSQAGAELSVVAEDTAGTRSSPHRTELQSSDAGCAPKPEPVCVTNGSFEGTLASAVATNTDFQAPPWIACPENSGLNTPDIINDSLPQLQGQLEIPKPTNGKTFLGLGQNEQVAETLCAPVSAGEPVSMRIDVSRILLGKGIAPDSYLAFLQVWGGLAADCSQHSLLWTSPALSLDWETFCFTARPQERMDSIMLRAVSDQSLTDNYVIVDNLVAVSACP